MSYVTFENYDFMEDDRVPNEENLISKLATANILGIRVWKGMMSRCYFDKRESVAKYYGDCTVCEEWHNPINFLRWFSKQNYDGNELDKDIINPGNKVYCPEYCCMVEGKINKLISNSGRKQGKYPRGVKKNSANSFSALTNVDGKRNVIGTFNNPIDASKSYKKFRVTRIRNAAFNYHDERICEGLMKHAKLLEDSINAF